MTSVRVSHPCRGLQARQDVNCVVHVHTHYSILPSIAGVDLVPVCHTGHFWRSGSWCTVILRRINDFEKASGLARALGKFESGHYERPRAR